MKLSQLETALTTMDHVSFDLPDGTTVPKHFHITEVGVVTKRYIDCGGTLRQEETISMQLWQAMDYDHRLKASKLANIIELAKNKLQLPDVHVEVEYQGSNTIERYSVQSNKTGFVLQPTKTACLALDACGIVETAKESIAAVASNCCSPDGGCC